MPPIHRTIKNKVKNYTFAEVKVREATSNDPWGPSTALMAEIAEMTYNIVAFAEIMQMVWKRVNDSGKNWRHVYKSLVLLDYLIKYGSEKVIQQSKESILMIQTLKDFQYMEEGKDHGHSVREKSKQLVALLKDDDRIKNERTKALAAKDRYAANTGAPRMTRSISEKNLSYSAAASRSAAVTQSAPRDSNATPASEQDEDLQLQIALAMSKEEHEEELKRRQGDELRLQMAIEESKKLSEQQQQHGGSNIYDNSANGLLDLTTDSTGHSSLPSSLTWDGQLSSSSLGGAAGGGAAKFDPWATPAQAPSAAAWDAPLYDNPAASQQPPPYPAAASNDIWSLSASTSSNNAFGQSAAASGNSWGASQPIFPSQGIMEPTYNNATNGNHGTTAQHDDFDFLSSNRAKSPQANANNIYSNFSLDPISGGNKSGGGSSDIWDMKGMDGALTTSSAAKTTSTGGTDSKNMAEKFLGANANLVDLDDLISKPPPQSSVLSPFSMTTTTRSQSPAAQLFAAKTHEEDRSKSVPLNQMMTSGVSPIVPGGAWGTSQPPMGLGYQAPTMGLAPMYPPIQPMAYPPPQQPNNPLYPQQHNPFM